MKYDAEDLKKYHRPSQSLGMNMSNTSVVGQEDLSTSHVPSDDARMDST